MRRPIACTLSDGPFCIPGHFSCFASLLPESVIRARWVFPGHFIVALATSLLDVCPWVEVLQLRSSRQGFLSKFARGAYRYPYIEQIMICSLPLPLFYVSGGAYERLWPPKGNPSSAMRGFLHC